MKKLKMLLTMFLLIFTLAFTACGSEEKKTDNSVMQEEDNGDTTDPDEIAAAFEEELTPLDEEELALLEDSTGGDFSEEDELTPLDESEMEQAGDSEEGNGDTDNSASDDESGDASTDEENSGTIKVEEDGTYTSKEEVAVYLHTYGKLPSNYITKKEAQELGWISSKGNLEEVAPGKSIGGDKFGNYDKMLPEEDGRTYQECDIDFDGGFRNEKRIVYSNDGLIFYTEDHYETFEQLY